MNIYLAGGVSGNLFPLWKEIANGGGTQMNIYLAGEHSVRNGRDALKLNGGGQLILESFYYCRKNDVIIKLLPRFESFMLDSGAFTFMQGANSETIDWDGYTEEYAEWINTNKIDLFFELDIDSIVGLKEVERLRAKLEQLTGKQPIPVWHINRGKEYFERMIKEYKSVALGGIVGAKKGTEIYKKYQSVFPWFIREAHNAGTKIHGLGFTSLEGVKKYPFDSVDSTAWLYGNRGGYLYKFNEITGEMGKIRAPEGYRLKSRDAALWNFNEWIKFQEYAKKHL